MEWKGNRRWSKQHGHRLASPIRVRCSEALCGIGKASWRGVSHGCVCKCGGVSWLWRVCFCGECTVSSCSERAGPGNPVPEQLCRSQRRFHPAGQVSLTRWDMRLPEPTVPYFLTSKVFPTLSDWHEAHYPSSLPPASRNLSPGGPGSNHPVHSGDVPS